MHTKDLRRTSKGTWYVEVAVSDDDDEASSHGVVQSLKTKTSRRRIPLHPTLMAIGFHRFVQHQKTSEDPRLFPGLKPDMYGDPAPYALKRFRETYLPQAMDLTPRQSFYSFRHTFRDALRRIEAPHDVLQALGGWSQGKLVSDNYGDKSDPDYLFNYVQKIDYPGLDLSHLHCSPSG